jgi:hypothetical protein
MQGDGALSARHLLVAAALLGVMAALLALSSLGKKLVYDEFDNLAYGYKILIEGPSVPRSGQRMPLLALNALACRDDGCRRAGLDESEAARLAARAPAMAFALLLAAAAGAWARELYGPRAGLVALTLSAFDPTLLAHGKQVTTDVAAAFFVLASAWALWRLARDRGRPRLNLALCAVAATGGLLSKYTNLLLLPVLGILLLRRRAAAKAGARRRVFEGLVFVLFVLFFLNAAYLFRGTFQRADRYEWKSQALGFLQTLPLPLPLPRVFVMGLDFSAYVQEQPDVGRGNNYVLGRLSTEGTWYAFPLMVLLKTPLGALALLALALARGPRGEDARFDLAFLLLPAGAFLLAFSLLVAPQLGIRYLLPALPFLTVCAASAASPAARAKGLVTAGLVAWSVASTLSYHPHYMSFFNELIGRRVNAYRYLADSNLDWEDRSRDIARFRRRHPEMRLIVEPEAPASGYVLVGANRLVGVYEPERYRWLRENFTPVGHVGYSYLLFEVTPERLEEAFQRTRGPRSPS